MHNSAPHKMIDANFGKHSKLYAYLVLAILVATVLTLEDLIDDDKTMWPLIRDFFLIGAGLSILFLLGGKLFLKFITSVQSFKKESWRYFDAMVLLGWVMILPVVFYLVFFGFLPEDEDNDSWFLWISFMLLSIVTMAIELFWISLERRQYLEIANERLLRSHDLAKYQALINQLSPHFLFNSLNVLSYLVYKDQRKADQFIEELSKIYRYILQLNETYLVPLSKELEFIESYIFLQKIRFQNNLSYSTDIDAQTINKFIPPLTLEVLVENAIKHNAIEKDQPLHIKIFTENGYLIVENNVQPRNGDEIQSTQVGLKNLFEKFSILESEPPHCAIKNGLFVAHVPLLNSIK